MSHTEIPTTYTGTITTLTIARGYANGTHEVDVPKPTWSELVMLRNATNAVARLTAQAVAAARKEGLSWEAIGDALGMSRQAAWERFGKTRTPKPPQVETLL